MPLDENREILMSQIKDDLICEIIRVSQTNLLGKKQSQSEGHNGEEGILDWIKCNAANYRKSFMIHLDSFSATELGEILSKLTKSTCVIFVFELLFNIIQMWVFNSVFLSLS